MASFLKGRTLKYGSNAFVAVLIMLGILVVVNFLSDRYHRRFDTTEGGIFSLSDQTVTLLDSLKKDVHVIAFFREQEKSRYENLLKEYAYHSKRFSYHFVDPDRQPAEANRYEIKAYQTSVIEVGDREERITSSEEKALTNAIAKAVRGRVKRVYFLVGHGEASIESLARDGYNRVKQALLEANYALRDSLLLARSRQVPRDCDLLIVAGPKTGFFQAEVDSIRIYLEAGGAALFLLDPGVQTGLEPMLKDWAIAVNNDYIVDGSGVGRLFGPGLLDAGGRSVRSAPDHVETQGSDDLLHDGAFGNPGGAEAGGGGGPGTGADLSEELERIGPVEQETEVRSQVRCAGSDLPGYGGFGQPQTQSAQAGRRCTA